MGTLDARERGAAAAPGEAFEKVAEPGQARGTVCPEPLAPSVPPVPHSTQTGTGRDVVTELGHTSCRSI